jgi:hypothetical protein
VGVFDKLQEKAARKSRAQLETYVAPKDRHPVDTSDDVCSNRHGGADTSVNAYRTVVAGPGGSKSRDMLRVELCIAASKAEGMTCFEVEQTLDMKHQTCSARISDLKREGRLIDTGRRRATTSATAMVLVVPTRGA